MATMICRENFVHDEGYLLKVSVRDEGRADTSLYYFDPHEREAACTEAYKNFRHVMFLNEIIEGCIFECKLIKIHRACHVETLASLYIAQ